MELHVKIQVVHGSITKYPADALVCPANGDLSMLAIPGGIQFAFLMDGGSEIFKEAEEVAKKYAQENEVHGEIGLVPTTSAHVTGAYGLPARYVIHSVAVEYDPKIKNIYCDSDVIQRSVKNVLVKAEELKVKSIGFPLLGTGLYDVSIEDSSRAIMNTCIDHLSHEGKNVNRVGISCYSGGDYRIAKEVAEILLQEPVDGNGLIGTGNGNGGNDRDSLERKLVAHGF